MSSCSDYFVGETGEFFKLKFVAFQSAKDNSATGCAKVNG